MKRWPKQRPRFRITRNGVPIRNVGAKSGINTGISYSMSYRVWEAAIAAGATLEELQKLEDGEFSRAFLVKLVAWYNCHGLVELHTEDAKSREMDRRSKHKR